MSRVYFHIETDDLELRAAIDAIKDDPVLYAELMAYTAQLILKRAVAQQALRDAYEQRKQRAAQTKQAALDRRSRDAVG